MDMDNNVVKTKGGGGGGGWKWAKRGEEKGHLQ